MSADPIDARLGESRHGVDEALYFASGDCKLFGWLHRPAPGFSTDTGLVICKPFGYEAVCSHRSVRAFARAAAAIGIPALRFDYSGTGDSADVVRPLDQLAAWSGDVAAAVAELRRRTGVDRVCVLGFRLGALLATLAATECTTINALILIAPVLSGSGYLRELRIARLASSLATDAAPSEDDGADGQQSTDGSLEACGFCMSASTVATLGRLDLSTRGAPPVAELLVIDRSDLPSARTWAGALSKSGVQVSYLQLPGFVEMMLRAPPFAAVPHAMIAAVRDWLTRDRVQTHPLPLEHEAQPAPAYAVDHAAVLQLAGDLPGEYTATERPLLFGSGASIFGILAEPRPGEPRKRAVILLNAGADYHIGASGTYVSLARRWARRGYTVLRMDLAGIGDSDARAGRPENEVFPPAALDDIRAAIELVRSRYAAGDVTLAGLCSGAYHALRAAVAGLPVDRILMVNPETFFWRDGASVNDIQMVEIVGSPRLYRRRLLSAAHWKKLLTGRADVWRIARVCVRRVHLALVSSLRDLARFFHISLRDDLGLQLASIAARGVRTVIVFALGEPGIDVLRIEAGSVLKRLGDRCRIYIVDGADHAFSRSGPRAELEAILTRELLAHHESARAKGQTLTPNMRVPT